MQNKLHNYISKFEEEMIYKNKMLEFLIDGSNHYLRTRLDGHFTGSAFLINSTGNKFLLMHHTKLDKWLQPGGHADGDVDLLNVAIREAIEETGIDEIVSISEEIFDIDVHLIPANSKEPEHYHYDVRFLLQSKHNEFIKNLESKELKWISFNNVDLSNFEYSIQRMIKKYINSVMN